MDTYEYEVVIYPSEDFKRLVFFCSDQGACGIQEVPSKDTAALQGILNQRGIEGWELVQLFFGKDGVVIFWKRKRH